MLSSVALLDTKYTKKKTLIVSFKAFVGDDFVKKWLNNSHLIIHVEKVICPIPISINSTIKFVKKNASWKISNIEMKKHFVILKYLPSVILTSHNYYRSS